MSNSPGADASGPVRSSGVGSLQGAGFFHKLSSTLCARSLQGRRGGGVDKKEEKRNLAWEVMPGKETCSFSAQVTKILCYFQIRGPY